jgi:hypothetical protein
LNRILSAIWKTGWKTRLLNPCSRADSRELSGTAARFRQCAELEGDGAPVPHHILRLPPHVDQGPPCITARRAGAGLGEAGVSVGRTFASRSPMRGIRVGTLPVMPFPNNNASRLRYI